MKLHENNFITSNLLKMKHHSDNNFSFSEKQIDNLGDLQNYVRKLQNYATWRTDLESIPDDTMIRVQVEKGKYKAVFDFIGQYDKEGKGLIYWKDSDTGGFIPKSQIVQYQILPD